MKIVTAEQMKIIEEKAMQKLSIPSIVLMENAALGVVKNCIDYLSKFKKPKAVVFCGKGNNGGDGFAIARQLFNRNVDVMIILYGDINKATEDCFLNYKIAENLGISILKFNEDKLADIISIIKNSELCIDALIGTGLKKELYHELNMLVDLINEYSRYTISVDISTGINSDNGNMFSSAVKADETVTFHLPKVGHFLADGAVLRGKLSLAQIGINYDKCDLESLEYNVLDFKDANKMLPERKLNSHKGNFGKVFDIAGSSDMTGAAFFNCYSAYTAGAGIVKLFSVKETVNVVRNLLPEALTCELSGKDGYICEQDFEAVKNELNLCSVVITGSGMGNNDYTLGFLTKLIENIDKPLILDADALNIIAQNKDLLKMIKVPCVITPHIGEMSRLTGLSAKEISKNIIDVAVAFSKEFGVITVLKDFRTVIANKDGEVFINTTGDSSMAKGGSGDCLAGTIGAFIAQGLNAFDGAVLGCYINGLAGETAGEKLGNYSVKARDIIDNIPIAINKIKKNSNLIKY